MYPIPPNEILIETKVCRQCSVSFPITDKDMEFYEKVSPSFRTGSGILGDSEINSEGQKLKKYQITPPTLCPDCRQQRRLSFRNERKLYKRKCDATDRDIISIYSPEKPYTVYHQDYWWSDAWDPMNYGREFDFGRGFFEQLKGLIDTVPKQNVLGANNENSDYCNLTADNKNCFLIFESSNNEDCLYGYWLQKCRDCTDCSFMHGCEHCFESFDCFTCYDSRYLFSCKNCTTSAFLEDCIGCDHCFGCVNLSNKEYHIFNKAFTKDAYEREILKYAHNITFKETFHALSLQFPKKNLRILNSSNCLGSQIQDSKNCIFSFHAYDAEDCKFCEHVWRNADGCMDVSTAGREAQYIYESINCGIGVYNFNSCVQCWTGKNLMYCLFSHNINQCFGCVGLKNQSYCIFNKQYTREEYEELVPRIIEHMMKTGEWGEFFPSSLSPFGYNETVAQEYFPLSRKEVLENPPSPPGSSPGEALGQGGNETFLHGPIFNWSDYEPPFPTVEKIIPGSKLPNSIESIPDDILNWAIECEVTGRPFRIIKQELEFYRKHNLPIPRRHPDQRHLDRMSLRNPRKLYERVCDCENCEENHKQRGVLKEEEFDMNTRTGKRAKKMITTYAPERTEMVYCEECYNREII